MTQPTEKSLKEQLDELSTHLKNVPPRYGGASWEFRIEDIISFISSVEHEAERKGYEKGLKAATKAIG